MTRRTALKVVAAATGYVFGNEASASANQSMSQYAARRPNIVLPLDGIQFIEVRLASEVRYVDPRELMAALAGKEPDA